MGSFFSSRTTTQADNNNSSVVFGWDIHDKVYAKEQSISNLANGYRDLTSVRQFYGKTVRVVARNLIFDKGGENTEHGSTSIPTAAVRRLQSPPPLWPFSLSHL